MQIKYIVCSDTVSYQMPLRLLSRITGTFFLVIPPLLSAFWNCPVSQYKEPRLERTNLSETTGFQIKTIYKNKKTIGTFHCRNCKHCPMINRSIIFKDSKGEKVFLCKHYTHFIYCLDCICGCFYVGLNKRRLRDRLNEHILYMQSELPYGQTFPRFFALQS